jgi:hypothetical protein
MYAVGVTEIAAGILVALRPQIGAYVVALWLWAIIANLLLIPGYYDIDRGWRRRKKQQSKPLDWFDALLTPRKQKSMSRWRRRCVTSKGIRLEAT